MDNFTLAVVIGNVVMIAMFVFMIAVDKGASPSPEAGKTAGKRSA